MAKEKNLTNVTSVAAADFLRVVTSAGASVKATLSTLKESIGVNALENRFRYISNTGSFNDITTSGLYYCQSVADPPSSNYTSWNMIVISASATAVKQIAVPLASNELMFIRYRDNSGWKAWVTMPTRAEVNTLNSNQVYKAGDVFTSRTWRAMGRAINSGKGIYCWIDFGKPITASGATFSLGAINTFFANDATAPTYANTVSSITISGNEIQFVLDTTNTLAAGKLYLIEMSGTAITLT